MKLFFSFLLMVMTPCAMAAEIENSKMSYIFQPCDFWRYEPSENSYTCSMTGSRIEVPSARDVTELQRTIQRLQATITALDERVKVLEGR